MSMTGKTKDYTDREILNWVLMNRATIIPTLYAGTSGLMVSWKGGDNLFVKIETDGIGYDFEHGRYAISQAMNSSFK